MIKEVITLTNDLLAETFPGKDNLESPYFSIRENGGSTGLTLHIKTGPDKWVGFGFSSNEKINLEIVTKLFKDNPYDESN